MSATITDENPSKPVTTTSKTSTTKAKNAIEISLELLEQKTVRSRQINFGPLLEREKIDRQQLASLTRMFIDAGELRKLTTQVSGIINFLKINVILDALEMMLQRPILLEEIVQECTVSAASITRSEASIAKEERTDTLRRDGAALIELELEWRRMEAKKTLTAEQHDTSTQEKKRLTQELNQLELRLQATEAGLGNDTKRCDDAWHGYATAHEQLYGAAPKRNETTKKSGIKTAK